MLSAKMFAVIFKSLIVPFIRRRLLTEPTFAPVAECHFNTKAHATHEKLHFTDSRCAGRFKTLYRTCE